MSKKKNRSVHVDGKERALKAMSVRCGVMNASHRAETFETEKHPKRCRGKRKWKREARGYEGGSAGLFVETVSE